MFIKPNDFIFATLLEVLLIGKSYSAYCYYYPNYPYSYSSYSTYCDSTCCGGYAISASDACCNFNLWFIPLIIGVVFFFILVAVFILALCMFMKKNRMRRIGITQIYPNNNPIYPTNQPINQIDPSFQQQPPPYSAYNMYPPVNSTHTSTLAYNPNLAYNNGLDPTTLNQVYYNPNANNNNNNNNSINPNNTNFQTTPVLPKSVAF